MRTLYQIPTPLTTPELFATLAPPMRKEIVFAIIIGLLLGLLVTFGIYTANKALKKKPQPETVTTIEAKPTPSPIAPEISLEIAEPNDNRVFDENSAAIAGKTSKQAIITILTENDEYFTQADENGLFSTKIDLIKGVNFIKIVAADLLGSQVEKELTLVYTTKLKESKESPPSSDEERTSE